MLFLLLLTLNFFNAASASHHREPLDHYKFAHYPLLSGSFADVTGNTVAAFATGGECTDCHPSFIVDNVPGVGAATVYSSRCDDVWGGGLAITQRVEMEGELTISALFRLDSASNMNASYVWGGDHLRLSIYPPATAENVWMQVNDQIYTFDFCLDDDSWNHLIMSRDITGDRLYLNGQLQTPINTFSTAAASLCSSSFVIGGMPQIPHLTPYGMMSVIPQLPGEIAQVQILYKALSPRQVEVMMPFQTPD